MNAMSRAWAVSGKVSAAQRDGVRTFEAETQVMQAVAYAAADQNGLEFWGGIYGER